MPMSRKASAFRCRASLRISFALLREGLEADVTSILVRLAAIEEALGLPKPSHSEMPEAKPSSLEATVREAGLSLGPSTDQEPGDLTEVCFEASTWSVPLLIGLVDAGWFDHAFAIILVLLNLFMQVCVHLGSSLGRVHGRQLGEGD